MTWRLHHEWTPGPTLGGSSVSTCSHCGTIWVAGGSPPNTWILPAPEGTPESKRVVYAAPVCDSGLLERRRARGGSRGRMRQ